MTGASFAVVTGSTAAATAAASAALNASTSASLAASNQDFWSLVAKDPYAGPVAVAVMLAVLVVTAVALLHALFVMWTER